MTTEELLAELKYRFEMQEKLINSPPVPMPPMPTPHCPNCHGLETYPQQTTWYSCRSCGCVFDSARTVLCDTCADLDSQENGKRALREARDKAKNERDESDKLRAAAATMLRKHFPRAICAELAIILAMLESKSGEMKTYMLNLGDQL